MYRKLSASYVKSLLCGFACFSPALTKPVESACRSLLIRKKFIKVFYIVRIMETITIPNEKYIQLKRKEKIADDLILQLEAGLLDLEAGRIKRVR